MRALFLYLHQKTFLEQLFQHFNFTNIESLITYYWNYRSVYFHHSIRDPEACCAQGYLHWGFWMVTKVINVAMANCAFHQCQSYFGHNPFLLKLFKNIIFVYNNGTFYQICFEIKWSK